jgi:hypothetical protein
MCGVYLCRSDIGCLSLAQVSFPAVATKRREEAQNVLVFNYCASLCLFVAILLGHLTDSEFFSASHVAAIGFAGRIEFFRVGVSKTCSHLQQFTDFLGE